MPTKPSGRVRTREKGDVPAKKSSKEINGAADLAQALFGDPSSKATDNPAKKRKIGSRKHESDNFDIFIGVDSDIQDDVDFTILDFIVFQAFESLVEERLTILLDEGDVDYTMADKNLEMVNTWLGFLQMSQGGKQLTNTMSFRLQLLQLLSLLTRRFRRHPAITSEASLQAIRHRNAQRANTWTHYRLESLCTSFGKRGEFPLSEADLFENRKKIFRYFRVEDPNPKLWLLDFYGSPDSAALADILLPFMELTLRTMENEPKWKIATQWMHLAAEWMLQATVEAYLICGDSGDEAVNEIFGYGYVHDVDEDGGIDVDLETNSILSIFHDKSNPGKEVPTWAEIRRHYLTTLLPKTGESTPQALNRASEQYPLKEFEKKVLDFLQEIHSSLPKPDLQQVDEGKIEGLPEEESRAMLERMRL